MRTPLDAADTYVFRSFSSHYVDADFDTIEKAPSSRKTAEKGTETGLPWSIAGFGSPALLYGIIGAAVSVGV